MVQSKQEITYHKMKNIRIIINADDCGISEDVNLKIEEYINKGLITSTTIMSNMPDTIGAQRLYHTYKEQVSFGIHMNLTEGKPMRKSQLLLDKGLLIEEHNDVIFNENNKIDQHIYTKEIENELFLELSAQIDNVLSHGIQISHIDSHHHTHTRPYMLRILPKLLKEYGIDKVRRMRNYMPSIKNRIPRNLWWYLIRMQAKGVRTTDYFAGYEEFIKLWRNGFIKQGAIIELMTHPGGYSQNSEGLLMESNLIKETKAKFINYNSI